MPHPITLSRLNDILKEHSTKVAIETSRIKMTYEWLGQKSDLLASHIYQPDLQQTILVMCEPGPAHVIGLLANIKANQVYLPIAPTVHEEHFTQIVMSFSVRTVIVESRLEHVLTDTLKKTGITLENILRLDDNGELLDVDTNVIALPEFNEYKDDAYIYYTSGSTGKPNAILGSHRSLAQFIDWEIEQFNIESDCRFSQLMRPTFDASLRDILVPLCSGGTLVIPDEQVRDNADQLNIWIEQSEITHVHTVPSLLRVLLSESEEVDALYSKLRYMFVSGEMLYAKDASQWAVRVAKQAKLINFYGPTETTMIRAFYEVSRGGYKSGTILPVGKPIADTRIAVINDGLICPVGEIGEVYIKTEFMTKGYWNNLDLNIARFVKNPITDESTDIVYKTGDLGRYLPDGNLEIIGRLDSQVKINGIRVELEEISSKVLGITGVDRAYTIAEKNENLQNELVCFYSGVPDESSLRDRLEIVLDKTIVPGHIVKIDEWPLSLNGKINRKKLLGLFELKSGEDITEELSEVEQGLLEIWKNVLGIPSISRKTSFFKIGGTSLRAIQLISRIFKHYDIKLLVQDVFKNDTIEKLAILIGHNQGEKYMPIPPVQQKDSYRASASQQQLWIAQYYDEQVSAYNIVNAWELSGLINAEAINHAFKEIIQRHEILTTTFKYKNGQLRFEVNSQLSRRMDAEWINFIGMPGKKKELIGEVLTDTVNESIDLQDGPLFKLKVIRLTEQKTICIILIHHIISDGWSVNIILNELGLFYNSYCERRKTNLSPLELQFKDISAWKQKQLSEAHLAKVKQYWQGELDGRNFINLPVDFDRPETHSFSGRTIGFSIDTEISEELTRICQKQRVTTFVFLLAVTDLLLYIFSGREDQVLGVPTAGRDHVNMEDQIGYYVNVIPLRIEADQKMSFENFLKYVGQKMVGGTTHGTYPIDSLVEQLNLRLHPDTNMLFDVMVQMQNTELTHKTTGQLNGLSIEEIPVPTLSSKFDLTFNFIEETNKIFGTLEYNADLYVEDTVTGLINKFEELIIEVTRHPDQEIGKLYHQFVTRTQKQKKITAAFTGKMSKM